MVLWEITLGTAYFLGLKRTYRLALKIQRRIVSPKRLKIRQFLHRRTRAIFNAALKVHRKVQQRDIEVGRNLGNWILRWLDKFKPAAQIRAPNPTRPKTTKNPPTDSSHRKTPAATGTLNTRNGDRESGRRLFTSSRNIWHTAYPTIAMMIRPSKPVGTDMQYRKFIYGTDTFELQNKRFGFKNGVIRDDIMQWMMQR